MMTSFSYFHFISLLSFILNWDYLSSLSGIVHFLLIMFNRHICILYTIYMLELKTFHVFFQHVSGSVLGVPKLYPALDMVVLV